ncbi:WW domain containing protein [Babesia divergens]|uniref:WW domain containing protein n=1 Tax=Babesia divergens TaxID=32595 RepID=A0AAD9GJP1_BABDI|nr:WW domain containing protein [Babesia divergens]
MSPTCGYWTEHVSKDGRRYFFNQQTKKSQWDKPDELKTPLERKIEETTPWKQYATAEGKVYYFNTQTRQSVWAIPPEVQQVMDEYEQQEVSNKESAKSAFLKWLEGFNFTQRTTWDSAVRQLESNERWQMFSILTKGEKKQLFSEFASQIHRRTQEEMRRKRGMVGDLITNELKNWEELTPYTTYVEFAKRCHKHEWWAWADEKTRDELFQETMDAMERNLKQKEREKRKESMERLEQEMEKSANGEVRDWLSVKQKFEGFEGLHLIDILECHRQVFIRIHQDNVKEAEKRAYRAQRKRRQRFMSLLEDSVAKGEINGRTTFEDFIKAHCTEAIYLDIVGQPGSTPYDLFKDVQRPLRNQYKKEREQVKQLISSGILDRDATLKEYENVLKEKDVCSAHNLPLIYESLQRRAHMPKKEGLQSPEEGEILNTCESTSSDESLESVCSDGGAKRPRHDS